MTTQDRTRISIDAPGLPACEVCGEPVKTPRWNYKRFDAPGSAGIKNNVHQACRVRRARERRANGR